MKNKEKNFISAVIYVHNAEKRIGYFLQNVMEVLEENFEHSEIICVNDRSDDKSVEEIRRISKGAISTSISILNMSYFHGVELAMNAGVDLAIGDFVFEFDTTVLDYDKSEIMRVYRRLLEGYDIVSASANKKQKKTSSLFYFLFDKFANLSYKMYTESFRVLSRRGINRISDMNRTVPYRKAVYANCGLRTDNIMYEIVADGNDNIEKGEKKYRKRLAIDTLILFTDVGYKFSITMTAVLIAVMVFMLLYAMVTYFTSAPVAGWTTTILFLSFSFFGMFGILTIIIKYLQIIVNLIFKKRRYSFEEIEKLTK